jgi:N-methylhydantoinase B
MSCWGVRGGRAGRPFSVVIDPGGPAEREVDALADGEPVRAGEVIRIRTTGGGGWGDPLERPYDEVLRDVRWRKVSIEGARDDYGVVVNGSADNLEVDVRSSEILRAELRGARTGHEPFFDRGPGYARLSGGAAPEVDWL